MGIRLAHRGLSLALCLAAVTLLCATPAAALAPDNSAGSAVLIEAGSGKVLYGKNEHARSRIASTTKIMTALVILETCPLDEQVTIEAAWTGIEGSSMGLAAGATYTVEQLLYGMMLASGNDAATALACHAAGSIERFAAQMNARAEQLGMADSHFANPHGLDADGHYSTAYDMALLASAAMENDSFRTIVATKEMRVGDRMLKNHNRLLWSCEGVIGVKTGYTKQAGRSLVSCAERDGMRLICVTLGDPNDWDDHAALYDWAEQAYDGNLVLDATQPVATLPVISGVRGEVAVYPAQSVTLVAEADSQTEVRLELPKFVYASVMQGQRAGTASVYQDGALHESVPLVFAEDVPLDADIPLSGWEKIKWAWYLANEYGARYPMVFY